MSFYAVSDLSFGELTKIVVKRQYTINLPFFRFSLNGIIRSISTNVILSRSEILFYILNQTGTVFLHFEKE